MDRTRALLPKLFALVAAIVVMATCSSTPTTPSTTPSAAPKIACPAAQTLTSPNGLPVAVTFAAPTVTGGTTPIATACSPLSGSKFPVGVDTVVCTASDSQQRTDACTFTISVLSAVPVPSPLLSLTRFTSFGDSITEGKTTTGVFRPESVAPCVVDDTSRNRSTSYPAQLRVLLEARYVAQAAAITVDDQGCGGETAAGAWASGRFVTVLTQDSPQVLLLLEGANDLSGTDTTSIAPMVAALKSMVDEAKRRTIVVFLGTLLPQRATAVAGAQYRATGPMLVQPANDQIRALAASGVFVVDLYQAFGGSADPYIDTDGLHPTLAGHQVIASAFYTSITQRLEISGTASTQARR